MSDESDARIDFRKVDRFSLSMIEHPLMFPFVVQLEHISDRRSRRRAIMKALEFIDRIITHSTSHCDVVTTQESGDYGTVTSRSGNHHIPGNAHSDDRYTTIARVMIIPI